MTPDVIVVGSGLGDVNAAAPLVEAGRKVPLRTLGFGDGSNIHYGRTVSIREIAGVELSADGAAR